jgi:hypothetical protein
MKLIQVMIKLIVSVMITSIVCVVCTFTVMNAYIDMVLDQYQLKSSALTAPNWSQFIAHLGKQAEGYHLFGDGSTPKPEQPNRPESKTRETAPDDAVAVFGQQKAADNKADPKASSSTGSSAGITGETAERSNGAASGSSAEITPVPGSSLSSDVKADSSAGAGAGGKVVVSGEEFTKKKEQLSNEDKNQIFKLLLTRVPQAEIQQISRMMEDGITASELTGIEQLLQNYLKPEEYSQLLSMIKP